jgi:hypothetical protein
MGAGSVRCSRAHGPHARVIITIVGCLLLIGLLLDVGGMGAGFRLLR